MVSVIIPCFNYGQFITETINSVLHQTYTDIEVIVINDGSTDNTEANVNLISARDSRVKCYTFPNSGLGASRNRGIKISTGDFVQFLDADDLLESRKFEQQLKLFSGNPDVDVAYGSVRYFKSNPFDPKDRLLTYWGVNKEWMPKIGGKGGKILDVALKGNFSHLSSALFKMDIVKKVGEFDNEISAVADYHFLLRCIIADAFFYYNDFPETYSLVRWHPSNMSKNPDYMRQEEIKMRHKLEPLLRENSSAYTTNQYAIKGLSLQISKSWKAVFLSNGKFESIKNILRAIGIDRIAKRIFYSRSAK